MTTRLQFHLRNLWDFEDKLIPSASLRWTERIRWGLPRFYQTALYPNGVTNGRLPVFTAYFRNWKMATLLTSYLRGGLQALSPWIILFSVQEQ